MANANQIAITGTTVAVAPAWAFSQAQGRTGSDALGTSDAATRAAAAQPRSAADSLGTSDAATSAVNRGRTASDSLGTSDAATRAPLAQSRTASDALGASTYDPTIDADSPVSHWKLGNATTAVDRKGLRDLPATPGSVATSPGLVANNGSDLANAFDSTNSFRRTPTLNDGLPYDTANWSIEAWVQPSVLATRRIANRSSDYELRLNAGGINSYTFSALNTSLVTTSVSTGFDVAAVGRTTHVVVTYDGTNLIIYSDGVERERKPATGLRSQPDVVPAISGGVGVGITGVIDEVAWYSSALPAPRVLAHFQAGSVRAPMDAAARAVLQPRSAADSLGTSDAAATRAATVRSRSSADALGTSDAAPRAPTARARSASDSLGTSDAATATYSRGRFAADALGNYPGTILRDGPTRYYRLAELGTSTSAFDEVSRTLRTGVYGSALERGFPSLIANDASDRSVFFPDVNNTRIDPASGGVVTDGTLLFEGVASRATSTSVDSLFFSSNSGSAFTGVVVQSGSNDVALLNETGTLKTWSNAWPGLNAVTHWAVEVSGANHTAELFINGISMGQVTGLPALDAGVWYFGGNPGRGFYWSGYMDEVAVWISPLANRAARIAAHASAAALGGGGVTDAATKGLFIQGASDVLGTSDAAVRAPLARNAADSLGTSDAAVTSGAPTRAAADSLGTSDAATRAAVVRARSAADALGSSDAATRAAIVQARTASDTAGHGNGQADQLNSDTRASYAAFGTGGGAPAWSSTLWTTGGLSAGYYLMAAPLAWGNADDQAPVRLRGTWGLSSTVGIGFVKPGSVAQGSVITVEMVDGSVRLAYDGPWNIGGGVQFGNISVPGISGPTFYILEATRVGNSIQVAVKDGSDSSYILAPQLVSIPAGAPRTAYGAGVALRPCVVMNLLGGSTSQVDWWEFGTAGDVATRTLALTPRTAADSLGTSDAATRAAARSRSATDSLGTNDAAARTAAQARSASDSLGTNDAATRAAVVRTRSSVDTLGTNDVAARTIAQARSASDALGTGDAATRAATARARNATDTLGTTDAATAARVLARSAADVVGSSDVAVRATTVRSRFASDTLGTSDVAVSTPLRTASDFLGTSDAATRTVTQPRTASDTLGSSDDATRAAIAGARSSSDVLGTDDLATRVASYARFSDDVLGSSDGATQTVSFGRLASDTLGTDDQAERVVGVSYRFAADELGTSDSALAFIPRFASDTLGTSDAATIVLQAQVLGTVLVSDSPSSLLAISDRPQLELALSSSALTIFDEPA